MPKYSLLAEDTNQISIFSLHNIKMSKQHRGNLNHYLNHYLYSLTYKGNLNHQQSSHYALSTLPVGIGNTLESKW